MKKILILSLISVLMLTGCSTENKTNTRIDNGVSTVNDVIQEQILENNKVETQEIVTEEQTIEEIIVEPTIENTNTSFLEYKLDETRYPNVDIDLTTMNGDMVYATVYQMMMEPDSYLGKVVKMKGTYNISDYTQENGNVYHFIMNEDIEACCSTGLEFIWDEGQHELSEYPAIGQEFVLIGTFSSYLEGEYMYVHFENATIGNIQE